MTDPITGQLNDAITSATASSSAAITATGRFVLACEQFRWIDAERLRLDVTTLNEVAMDKLMEANRCLELIQLRAVRGG